MIALTATTTSASSIALEWLDHRLEVLEPTNSQRPTGPGNDRLLALGTALIRRRKTALLLVLAAACLLASGLSGLKLGFKVDGFFESNDPELQLAMQHYGDASEDGCEPPDRLLLFAWAESDPFAEEVLARLRAFESICDQHSIVSRVTTLANASVPGQARSTPAQIAASATFRQLLVSRLGDAVGGIIVLQQGWHHEELQSLCSALRDEVASDSKQLNLCGLPFHQMISRQLVRADMSKFLPIGTAVAAVLLFWLVPHWLLALLALAVVPLTLASTLGVMGMCGVEITMLTSTLPTLLLCMSVADGLHMVGRFIEERERDGNAQQAAARSFAALFVPCLLTSLTTIVGFASLLHADLRDLGYLGGFAAIGMGFAFLYTMLLMPPAMSFVESKIGKRPADPAALIVRGARHLQKFRPRWWIGTAAVLASLCTWQATKLETDHRITADLWPDSDVMQQLRFYEERFVGIVPGEVLVEVDRGFGATERAELATLIERLERLDGVTRSFSIADLFADGVSPLMLGVLRTAEVLPAGLISKGGKQARILVFRGDLGTRAWQSFAASVQRESADLKSLDCRLAGLQMVGTAQVLSMTGDLRNSFLGSIFVIFGLVWLQCRRFQLAAVAMFACIVPMVCVLAVMALCNITLRPLTVISFCVALGLMIDDTIHLASRWREERQDGHDRDESVQRALATAGRPVVITTLMLLVGFVTILGSGFRGTHTFGLLVDLSLLAAVGSALVLLPSLLRVLGPKQAGLPSDLPARPNQQMSD